MYSDDPSSTQDVVIASSYFSIYIHFISIIPSFSEDMAAGGPNKFLSNESMRNHPLDHFCSSVGMATYFMSGDLIRVLNLCSFPIIQCNLLSH